MVRETSVLMVRIRDFLWMLRVSSTLLERRTQLGGWRGGWPVQFSAGIDVPQTVFIIVLILNSSLWLIPAGNSRSATVHEEPPQMRAPPPLMRDHPSWPVVELFMYNLVLGLCKISPNTGRSGEKDDVETCWIPHGRCWGCLFIFWHRINAKYHSISYRQWGGRNEKNEGQKYNLPFS